jgi:proline iminopeptidase
LIGGIAARGSARIAGSALVAGLALAAGLLPFWGCAGPGPAADTAARPDTLLAVGGTRLWVHQEGSGDPIVVVHGGPVLDHGYMVEPLRPLADEYRLVFFDQRLSGRSDGIVDSASVRLDTLVSDIEGIRVGLGLDRIHLLGHSWGGLLAAGYAVRHPERVSSLILVSPNPPSAALWQQMQLAEQAAIVPADTAGMGALRQSTEFAAREPAAIERMLQLSFRAQLADQALADSLRFHVADDYGERSRQFGYLMPDLAAYDLTAELQALDVPALVLYGEAEAGAEIGAAAYREALPGAAVRSVAGAGHFAFLERPAPFLAAVRDLIEGNANR